MSTTASTLAFSQTTEIVAAAIFAVAVLHTFSTKIFERLAHRYPTHHGVFHLLGEVEAVFGFWSIILFGWLILREGLTPAVQYADTRNYTEPLFVFAIMVIAASRPIMAFARSIVESISRIIPTDRGMATYFVLLSVVPLLGSFITEPAAMTLAALLLAQGFFRSDAPSRFKYATIGVLFVNISIGGTLTHFAAPPVLMVAAKWGWDSWFMLTHFGYKAAIAVFINAFAVTFLFRDVLKETTRKLLSGEVHTESSPKVPAALVAIHLAMIAGVVVFAHHPPIFLGIFLVFMGLATAYSQHHDRLILREGLLVAFFLAGLVVLGGMQAWWLQPLLAQMSPTSVYYGATALTAITDNAALTYLASLVEGLSDEFKYAVVSGAVTGGGLTIIANAPNPAGASILRRYFQDETVDPLKLFLAASLPTVVTILAFRLL
jgi:Na+/H+ antiporter NhaD/arsenite permease-like protein